LCPFRTRLIEKGSNATDQLIASVANRQEMSSRITRICHCPALLCSPNTPCALLAHCCPGYPACLHDVASSERAEVSGNRLERASSSLHSPKISQLENAARGRRFAQTSVSESSSSTKCCVNKKHTPAPTAPPSHSPAWSFCVWTLDTIIKPHHGRRLGAVLTHTHTYTRTHIHTTRSKLCRAGSREFTQTSTSNRLSPRDIIVGIGVAVSVGVCAPTILDVKPLLR
jgi:hypothetical protein